MPFRFFGVPWNRKFSYIFNFWLTILLNLRIYINKTSIKKVETQYMASLTKRGCICVSYSREYPFAAPEFYTFYKL